MINSPLPSDYHFFFFVKYCREQDNGELISRPSRDKFATIFMKSGNINLINDVLKVMHGFGGKIDQVCIQYSWVSMSYPYFPVGQLVQALINRDMDKVPWSEISVSSSVNTSQTMWEITFAPTFKYPCPLYCTT